jgi:hypothetical protein
MQLPHNFPYTTIMCMTIMYSTADRPVRRGMRGMGAAHPVRPSGQSR